MVRVPILLDAGTWCRCSNSPPTWCLVERKGEDLYLVRGDELLAWLREALAESEGGRPVHGHDQALDHRPKVPLQASLRQAMDTIRASTAEAYVYTSAAARPANRSCTVW